MKRISFVLLVGLIFVTAAAAQLSGFNQRGKATQELNAEGLSIAHPSLPINSKVRVANTVSGKEVEATVVGRVPASGSRIADLSEGVWQELALTPDTEIRIYTAPAPPRARAPEAAPAPPAEPPASVAEAEKPKEPEKPAPAPEPAAEVAKAAPASDKADTADGDKLPGNITININTDGFNPTPFGSSADADFLAWIMAMMMDSRDSRDFRDSRESREAREARESRDSRDIREAREKELRDSREARERELRDTHDARERELRNAREARERELSEARDAREAREAREERVVRMPPPPQVVKYAPAPYASAPPAPAKPEPEPVKPAPAPAEPAPLPAEPASVYAPAEPVSLYPVQPLKPVPFEEMQIIPGLPDPQNGRIYRLQVASFSMPEAAFKTVQVLDAVGFSAVHEKHDSAHRVVVENIPASMAYSAIEKLGALGIRQVWVRE